MWPSVLGKIKIVLVFLLRKVMMWPMVLMKINIVFMLSKPPLISILQEDLIILMEVIKDEPLGVPNPQDRHE